tara:strand:- start:471 stop:809 length:339 start_codon:yes stop_codon:yes gene_type:complete
MSRKIQPGKLRDTVLLSLDELKAIDPVSLNVKKLSSFTDYILIASGSSKRHIQSIGEKVIEDLKKNRIKPMGIEGQGIEGWLLIDLGDVVVHVMSTDKRSFYDLEGLWDPNL